MSDFFILNDAHELVPATIEQWGRWFQYSENRLVDRIEIGDVLVSTVCIGVPGELFETMIFNGPHDQYQTRCNTWSEAIAMHARAVAVAGAP